MTFQYVPPQTPLEILHFDEQIIVLNKPSGLLSVPGRAEAHKDSLYLRVLDEYPDATVVHRLDMDTSGVMVMARTKEAHRHISRQFEEKTTKKTYICLVDGLVKDDAGSVDLPMRCDWPNRPLQIVDFEQGKKALTHWKVLERLPEKQMTRLELTPVTGRSHQLRVHCQAMGHVIIGDRFYAPEDIIAKSDRLCLHAACLTLMHPGTGEMMTFDAVVGF